MLAKPALVFEPRCKDAFGVRSNVISSALDVMGGTTVFAGTRVPVQTLVDYIEGGETIDEFLKGFPTAKREQAIAFLDEAR